MDYILKIDNLHYNNILKGVSLSLKKNTFNVLMGANGSGKSTLIKTIFGLINYNGNIVFDNQLLTSTNIENLRHQMGILTDDNILLEGNVLFNLMYPLKNLKYSEQEAKNKIYNIADKLDINKLLFKNISELSFSERKIVKFSISIIHEPKLLLIDDTFDELDNYYRSKVLTYLKKLKKTTILFVTNNEKDIQISDNLFIIKNGKVKEFSGIDEALKNEKIFRESNSRLPFCVELSNKLKFYDLIDDDIFDLNELVNEVWK